MKTNAQLSMAEGLVILHLSDLHFGNKNRFQNYDLTAFGKEFSHAVLRAACEEQKWGRPVDLVVVSGDISEVAKPKEFADCCTFLKTVVQRLNLNLERTIFVPGNHDFSWAECEIVDALRKIEEFDDAEYERHLTEVKFKHFDKFLQNFYGLTLAQVAGHPPLHEPSGAYLRDFVIDGLLVSFAALNTSEKETHKRFGGELSKEQAQPLIRAWMQDAYKPYLKIAVVHHNPLATPLENRYWTEDWLNDKIKANKLPVTVDWLVHYTADMAGFKDAEFLQRIVMDTGAHLVLHGHHHNPTVPVMWKRRAGGVAPILSVGSFGLNAEQIPTEQPLTCQLIFFRRVPEARLIAVPLEFDPNYRLPGSLEKGQFRLNLKSESVYNDTFSLPEGWIARAKPAAEKPATAGGASPQVSDFVATYRARLSAAYSSYDLKNLGVLPVEMHKTVNPQLDDVYLPLRFDEKFDINKTGQGKVLDANALIDLLTIRLVRGQSLAITGAGKTTWMRYTFRRRMPASSSPHCSTNRPRGGRCCWWMAGTSWANGAAVSEKSCWVC